MCAVFFSHFFNTKIKKLKTIFIFNNRLSIKSLKNNMQTNCFYNLPEDLQLYIYFLAAKKVADLVIQIPNSKLMQRKKFVLEYFKKNSFPSEQGLSTDDLMICRNYNHFEINKLVDFLKTKKNDYNVLQESCNINCLYYEKSWREVDLVKALMCI